MYIVYWRGVNFSFESEHAYSFRSLARRSSCRHATALAAALHGNIKFSRCSTIGVAARALGPVWRWWVVKQMGNYIEGGMGHAGATIHAWGIALFSSN